MYPPDLIRQLQSRYLRDELRYDKWGAQGKILLAREVLSSDTFIPLEQIINEAFPRTFTCQRHNHALDYDLVEEYYSWVKYSLDMYFESEKSISFALEETAEKFCAEVADIENIVL